MSINKVLLMGNLTSDATIRTVGQGTVASFSIATNERFKKADGTVGENTEFHNIELWGNAGVHPYLTKGTTVFVEGRIATDKWTDQNGQGHSVMKIKTNLIQLVGGRPKEKETHVGGMPFKRPEPSFSAPTYSAPVAPPAAPQAPVPPTPPAQPAYVPPYGAVAQPPRPTAPAQPQGAPASFSDDLPF